MSNMMIRIQNDAVRLAADDGGLKSLRSADGRRQLVWTTLSEYSLQVQSGEGGVALDSRQAACAELPAEKGWARRFTHPLLDVDVVYTLTDAAALKAVTVTARAPLTLCYARAEVASVNGSLSRGGEGQPLFAGADGFISSTFPVAENQADGNLLSLRQAPFASLEAGESFSLAPVAFGLNITGDMAESFLRFLHPRRPHPADSLRIYCDWGAHDELSDDNPPELDEAMARRLLADLRSARERTGLTFDYYLMDAYWFAPDAPYTAFKKSHWPQGPAAFIREVEEAGMRFGLWFDVNLQKVDDGQKKVLRGGSADELCMGYKENMDKLFDAVEFHVRENRVRLLKFDFAFFDCSDPSHTFHSTRHTASKEPGVRRFIERLSELRGRYPDLRVLAYNGFTTDLSFIGSVDPNRRGLAVSPFWAQAVDYVYCGDPRPAEMPAPLDKSLLHYTDCMMEQFRDALFPTEAIDDHGTMLGNTGTIYYLGRRTLRDSYMLNIVRGTRKRHLYGETSLLTPADWEFMAAAEPLFDFICSPACRTDPILRRPSEHRLYGYSNTDGDRGLVTLVNASAAPLSAAVKLPCWQEDDRLVWRLLYHDGEWVNRDLPKAGALAATVEPFGVDIYAWERADERAAAGYVDVDSACQVRLPLPAGCRRVGLRFVKQNFSPLRAASGDRPGLHISAEGCALTRRGDVPVWSGVSFAIYDIDDADPSAALLFTNTNGEAAVVCWQQMPREE